jgi:DNA-binding MarR family transcriptional regulator
MKITLGNLQYIAKKLQNAAYESAVVQPIEPPMTPGESAVMEYLVSQTEEKSIREIVVATGIVQSWVSTVVKSLKERGWIDVARSEVDRRMTTVKVKDGVMSEAEEVLARDATLAVKKLAPTATQKELEAIKKGLETLFTLMQKPN